MTLTYRPSDDAQLVRLIVLETDEPHADTQAEKGSFGEIVFHHFYQAGRSHHPPLGISVEQQFVVTEQGGKMPTFDDMQRYDGLLITGSVYDAHGNNPWILQLLDLLKELWTRRPDFHFTGVCFGHQILSRLLGAKVAPAPSGDWELGHSKIDLTSTGQRLFRTRDTAVYLHQMHQDHVVEAPDHDTAKGLLTKDQEVLVWGSSPHTKIQGLYIQDRLFSTQAHLAFDQFMVKRQIEIRVQAGSIQDMDHANEAAETAHLDHDGREVAKAILRLFHFDDDGF